METQAQEQELEATTEQLYELLHELHSRPEVFSGEGEKRGVGRHRLKAGKTSSVLSSNAATLLSKQFDLYKGTVTIQAPVHHCVKAVQLEDERSAWDTLCVGGSLIKSVKEAEDLCVRVMHHHFSSLMHGVVSARDFVYVTSQREHPDEPGTWLSVGRSTNATTEMVSTLPGVVRGQVVFAGIVMRPLDKDTTHVTLYTSTDPKGAVPAFAVNMGGLKCLDNLLDMRSYLERPEAEKPHVVEATRSSPPDLSLPQPATNNSTNSKTPADAKASLGVTEATPQQSSSLPEQHRHPVSFEFSL